MRDADRYGKLNLCQKVTLGGASIATSAHKMDVSLLPQEAANELYDFYQFLLQKHRRIKRAIRNVADTSSYPLRGLPYRYDAPFESVAAEEWETLT